MYKTVTRLKMAHAVQTRSDTTESKRMLETQQIRKINKNTVGETKKYRHEMRS